MPRKKKDKFYALPLTGDEFSRFQKEMEPEALKKALRRATIGQRPPITDYFLFLKSTPEAMFCFVISKRKKTRNRFYVLDNPGAFAAELFERMRAVYPQEFSDALLDLGVDS